MPITADAFAYSFDAAPDVDHDALSSLLGGKGAGLVRMRRAGLRVPPGFTLTTDACRSCLADGWSAGHQDAVRAGLTALEAVSGKQLGSSTNPLLVSVRSGAAVSMPGMMDTVLNVGMTGGVEVALAALTGDAVFAADTHRRALLNFADVVLGATADQLANAAGAGTPNEVRQRLAATGFVVPVDPTEQVTAAVQAVFGSWMSDRARRYREIESIDDAIATAATVQSMVFGNLGSNSGTGVGFTRDPSTGHDGLMGDFLVCAQGEDVVAGDHATRPLADMADLWPDAWRELQGIARRLEHDYTDLVDIEFTVEQGVLYVLQARRGKRSPLAAFRIAVAMANDPECAVDRAEAVRRCGPYLDAPPTIGDATHDDDATVIGSGLAASPGRAIGVVCTDVAEACRLETQGIDVVLVRRETSPADVHGMAASVGMVTTLGGLVSHAAVVARSWGKPAVVGAVDLTLDGTAVIGQSGRVEAGTVVTVDGDNGRLLLGAHPRDGKIPDEVVTIRQWQAALAADTSDNAASSPDHTAVAAAAATGSESESDFVTLHMLRIKGMATSETIAAMVAAEPDAVRARLDALVAGEMASFMEARSFFRLTPAGREAHTTMLESAVAAFDFGSLQYHEFLGLNDELKQICTDWQIRNGDPNDHTDSAYDQAVIARLADLDARAHPLVATFAAVIPWTEPYPDRLSAACARAAAGDNRAFTGVMCDSYHDIWMELHEDLILVQGIDRAAEGST